MQVPPIDPRDSRTLSEAAAALAQTYSGWSPRPDGAPDAGQALIRIFGRFAELVVDRINRAPEKNYLAFLNVIGTQMLPPQPARVPLTFTLSSSSPLDAMVPAGTQVAAPPLEGEGDEVTFETDASLVVSRAQLQAVYVGDPETDTYSDRTRQATGQATEPFAPFSGDQPTPHQLHIACDPLLGSPGTKDVTLLLSSPDTVQWQTWPISWAYWDGKAWTPASSSAQVQAGGWRVTLAQLPQLPKLAVGGIEAGWVRAQLDMALSPGRSDLTPESVAVGSRNPQDFSGALYPFGEANGVKFFYLSADDAIAPGKALVRLQVSLLRAGAAGRGADVRLNWTYKVGNEWKPLGQSSSSSQQLSAGDFDFKDGTFAFTRSGEISFHVPEIWPREFLRSRMGRWLRVEVADDGGRYTTPPQIESLKVSYGWELPRIGAIAVQANVGGQLSQAFASACLSHNDFTYADHSATAGTPQGQPFFPFTAGAELDPALYLGFDRPFDPRPVTLYLQVEPPLPEEVAADRLVEIDPFTTAQVTWECAGPTGWRQLGAQDQTQALSSRGLVNFVGPSNLVVRQCFGQSQFWLRARWARGYFPVPPRLRQVLLNTTWASQVTGIENEILGSSNGSPNQVFATAQTPVQPGQQVVVREPQRPAPAERAALADVEGADAITETLDAAGQPDEVWVRWHAVPDFYDSGPTDRHYTVDALTGEMRFGDGRAGLIPPRGRNNVRATYRAGGGAQGNRAAETIVQLKSGIPYIEAVTNHEPAQGGAPRESVDRLAARGPRVLRHRDRAVTAEDLEDLAYSASAEVARVAAVPPTLFDPNDLWLDPQQPSPKDAHARADAGRVGVIVVPSADAARPAPSLSLLRLVRTHLQTHCPPTAEPWVAGPEWVRVTVTATVVPRSLEAADLVGGRVTAALARFLHPLTGGLDGQGWAFGRKPHRSDLFAIVEAVDGVDHARTLNVNLEPESEDLADRLKAVLSQSLADSSKQPPAPDLQRWLARALVYSGPHEITTALDPA